MVAKCLEELEAKRSVMIHHFKAGNTPTFISITQARASTIVHLVEPLELLRLAKRHISGQSDVEQ